MRHILAKLEISRAPLTPLTPVRNNHGINCMSPERNGSLGKIFNGTETTPKKMLRNKTNPKYEENASYRSEIQFIRKDNNHSNKIGFNSSVAD